jgi:hypothetical protein
MILTDLAAQKMGIPEGLRRILTMHTLEPDSWTLLQMPAHYMPFSAYIGAQAAADARRMLVRYSDPRIGYQRLAIAMHFMADCASPFHTSLFNVRAQKYHRRYEEYVARNMLKGHAFKDALVETPSYWIHPEYTRDLVAGARTIAARASEEFDIILDRIRSCHLWEQQQEIASITTDLLICALRMCETQIYTAISVVPDERPLTTPSGSLISYRNPLGALLFYRTHASALFQPSGTGREYGTEQSIR